MPPYRLSATHLAGAADTLHAAFARDPLAQWVFDSPAHYARAGRWFMTAHLRHALLFGEVWATPGLGAVSAWLPPLADLWAWPRLRLSGLAEMPAHLGAAAYQRYMELVSLLDDQPHPPGPAWYLLMLGVRPNQQRRGLGSQLVRAKLRQTDASGHAVTLETNNPANLPFYAALGFAVYAHGAAHGAAPGQVSMWGLARPPIRP